MARDRYQDNDEDFDRDWDAYSSDLDETQPIYAIRVTNIQIAKYIGSSDRKHIYHMSRSDVLCIDTAEADIICRIYGPHGTAVRLDDIAILVSHSGGGFREDYPQIVRYSDLTFDYETPNCGAGDIVADDNHCPPCSFGITNSGLVKYQQLRPKRFNNPLDDTDDEFSADNDLRVGYGTHQIINNPLIILSTDNIDDELDAIHIVVPAYNGGRPS